MRKTAVIAIACFFITVPVFADEPEQVATAKALEEVKAATPPDQVYDIFNRFCKANFGAKAEPLVHETFGKKIEFVADSLWTHASERSASIGWMTNLPATVEISGAKSEAASGERPFYVHLWRLKDLEPGRPVEVTITCTDEFGRKASRKITVTPQRPQGAVDFPGELAGPPYVIDKPGYYILSQDITAPRTAIEVTAEGVTLDLGGHTVTYGTETVPKEQFTDKWMSYVLKGSFGIKNMSGSKFRLLNGKVIQGAGNNRGNDESCGFNALYIRSCSDVELAGMEVDFWTPQNWGVRLRNCGNNVLLHHNVVRDRGTKMHNRHGSGCGALGLLASKGENYVARYNLVARTRQNGIRGDYQESHHNEIYVDSWATNSFATSIRPGHLLHHNRIFGTGYHAIAVPWGNGIKVHDNFIHMAGINTGKRRWWEGFGDQNSMNGLRHTQWGDNKRVSNDSDYARKVVVITGRNGAQIRGAEFFSDTYIKGLTLRDSTIKILSLDEKTTKAACVATHGNPRREKTQNPVFYRNCTFISNINILRLGDDYGTGSHHHFIGCRFIREGKAPRFHTIVAMGGYWSRDHRLIDCVFAGGAEADDVDWGKTKPGTRNYTVEYTLTVKTRPGAEVVITDAKVAETVIKADDKGIAGVPLAQYRMNHAGKEMLTPHTVKAAGKTATVTMDAPKQTDLRQEPQGGAVPRNVYIVPTHPKFAFRKADLAELRKRCLTTHRKEYALLKANADAAAFLERTRVAPGLLWQLPASRGICATPRATTTPSTRCSAPGRPAPWRMRSSTGADD